jgi:hypothetical protein
MTPGLDPSQGFLFGVRPSVEFIRSDDESLPGRF